MPCSRPARASLVAAISWSPGEASSPAGGERPHRRRASGPKSIIATVHEEGPPCGSSTRGNFSPSLCHPVTAAALRVYPPNQNASETVPFPFLACSGTGILSVESVSKG